MITLYQRDVIQALKQMPDESVDMQITSPPYWGLRDYGEGVEVVWEDGWKGQLGLEPDFNLYIKHLIAIFDEVKRVLKKEGTCWINLGDTYASSPSGLTTEKAEEWDEKGDGMFGRLHNLHTADRTQSATPKQMSGMQPKCLCAIPERFIIEMINRGWILRNKIIWHKPNHMPTSVKDRFANSWEYLFLFSKSKKYYFDLDAVREPHTYKDGKDLTQPITSEYRNEQGKLLQSLVYNKQHPLGKNPDDVVEGRYTKAEIEQIDPRYKKGTGPMGWAAWKEKHPSTTHPLGKNPSDIIDFGKYGDKKTEQTHRQGFHKERNEKDYYHPLGKCPDDFFEITTRGYKEAHFAVFPEKLVERPIKTTPKEICNKCGKARERIVEKSQIAFSGEEIKKYNTKFQDGQKQVSSRLGAYRNKLRELGLPETSQERKTTGWTSCKCGKGFHPAVILDIFAGSGTTMKVARRLNRDSIGIEIKPEYCELIRRRLFGRNQTLFPNEFKLIK